MFKNRLLPISILSILVLSLLQVMLGRLVPSASPVRSPQSSSEQQLETPMIEATDADFSFSHIVVPDQGRPVGRIRGGGSR